MENLIPVCPPIPSSLCSSAPSAKPWFHHTTFRLCSPALPALLLNIPDPQPTPTCDSPPDLLRLMFPTCVTPSSSPLQPTSLCPDIPQAHHSFALHTILVSHPHTCILQPSPTHRFPKRPAVGSSSLHSRLLVQKQTVPSPCLGPLPSAFQPNNCLVVLLRPSTRSTEGTGEAAFICSA